MSKEIKASDYFKEYRNKPTPNVDKWYNNRSVYSKNFVKSHYRNTANDFSKLVSDEDILSIRLVDPSTKETYIFNREFNNRVQYFYYGKDQKKIDYKEITKVEQISGEGYYNLKEVGYNHFYELHKKNDFGIEQVLSVLAFKK